MKLRKSVKEKAESSDRAAEEHMSPSHWSLLHDGNRAANTTMDLNEMSAVDPFPAMIEDSGSVSSSAAKDVLAFESLCRRLSVEPSVSASVEEAEEECDAKGKKKKERRGSKTLLSLFRGASPKRLRLARGSSCPSASDRSTDTCNSGQPDALSFEASFGCSVQRSSSDAADELVDCSWSHFPTISAVAADPLAPVAAAASFGQRPAGSKKTRRLSASKAAQSFLAANKSQHGKSSAPTPHVPDLSFFPMSPARPATQPLLMRTSSSTRSIRNAGEFASLPPVDDLFSGSVLPEAGTDVAQSSEGISQWGPPVIEPTVPNRTLDTDDALSYREGTTPTLPQLLQSPSRAKYSPIAPLAPVSNPATPNGNHYPAPFTPSMYEQSSSRHIGISERSPDKSSARKSKLQKIHELMEQNKELRSRNNGLERKLKAFDMIKNLSSQNSVAPSVSSNESNNRSLPGSSQAQHLATSNSTGSNRSLDTRASTTINSLKPPESPSRIAQAVAQVSALTEEDTNKLRDEAFKKLTQAAFVNELELRSKKQKLSRMHKHVDKLIKRAGELEESQTNSLMQQMRLKKENDTLQFEVEGLQRELTSALEGAENAEVERAKDKHRIAELTILLRKAQQSKKESTNNLEEEDDDDEVLIVIEPQQKKCEKQSVKLSTLQNLKSFSKSENYNVSTLAENPEVGLESLEKLPNMSSHSDPPAPDGHLLFFDDAVQTSTFDNASKHDVSTIQEHVTGTEQCAHLTSEPPSNVQAEVTVTHAALEGAADELPEDAEKLPHVLSKGKPVIFESTGAGLKQTVTASQQLDMIEVVSHMQLAINTNLIKYSDTKGRLGGNITVHMPWNEEEPAQSEGMIVKLKDSETMCKSRNDMNAVQAEEAKSISLDRIDVGGLHKENMTEHVEVIDICPENTQALSNTAESKNDIFTDSSIADSCVETESSSPGRLTETNFVSSGGKAFIISKAISVGSKDIDETLRNLRSNNQVESSKTSSCIETAELSAAIHDHVEGSRDDLEAKDEGILIKRKDDIAAENAFRESPKSLDDQKVNMISDDGILLEVRHGDNPEQQTFSSLLLPLVSKEIKEEQDFDYLERNKGTQEFKDADLEHLQKSANEECFFYPETELDLHEMEKERSNLNTSTSEQISFVQENPPTDFEPAPIHVNTNDSLGEIPKETMHQTVLESNDLEMLNSVDTLLVPLDFLPNKLSAELGVKPEFTSMITGDGEDVNAVTEPTDLENCPLTLCAVPSELCSTEIKESLEYNIPEAVDVPLELLVKTAKSEPMKLAEETANLRLSTEWSGDPKKNSYTDAESTKEGLVDAKLPFDELEPSTCSGFNIDTSGLIEKIGVVLLTEPELTALDLKRKIASLEMLVFSLELKNQELTDFQNNMFLTRGKSEVNPDLAAQRDFSCLTPIAESTSTATFEMNSVTSVPVDRNRDLLQSTELDISTLKQQNHDLTVRCMKAEAAAAAESKRRDESLESELQLRGKLKELNEIKAEESNTALKRKIATLELHIFDLDAQNQELKACNNKREAAEKEYLNFDPRKLEQKLCTVQDELEWTRAELEARNQSFVTMGSQLDTRAQQEMRRLRQELEIIRGNLDDKNIVIDELEKVMQSRQDEVNDMKERVSTLEDRSRDMQYSQTPLDLADDILSVSDNSEGNSDKHILLKDEVVACCSSDEVKAPVSDITLALGDGISSNAATSERVVIVDELDDGGAVDESDIFACGNEGDSAGLTRPPPLNRGAAGEASGEPSSERPASGSYEHDSSIVAASGAFYHHTSTDTDAFIDTIRARRNHVVSLGGSKSGLAPSSSSRQSTRMLGWKRSSSVPPRKIPSGSDRSNGTFAAQLLAKDTRIENLERLARKYDEAIAMLRTDLATAKASFDDRDYVSALKIEKLLEENTAYASKVAILEKEFRNVTSAQRDISPQSGIPKKTRNFSLDQVPDGGSLARSDDTSDAFSVASESEGDDADSFSKANVEDLLESVDIPLSPEKLLVHQNGLPDIVTPLPQVKELQEKKDLLKAKDVDFIAKAQHLQFSLEESNKKFEFLGAEKSKLVAQVEQLQLSVDELQQKVKILETEKTASDAKAENLQSAIDVLNEVARERSAADATNIAELRRNKDDLLLKVKELEKGLVEMTEMHVDELSKARSQSNSDFFPDADKSMSPKGGLGRLFSRRRTFSGSREDAISRSNHDGIDPFTADSEPVCPQTAYYEDTIESLRSNILNLQNFIKDTEDQHDIERRRLQAEAAANIAKVEALEREFIELNQNQDPSRPLTSAPVTSENETITCGSIVSLDAAYVGNLKSENSKNKKRIADFEVEVTKLKKAYQVVEDHLRQEINRLSESKHEVERELKDQIQTMSKAFKTVEQGLRGKISTLESTNENLEITLKRLESRRDNNDLNIHARFERRASWCVGGNVGGDNRYDNRSGCLGENVSGDNDPNYLDKIEVLQEANTKLRARIEKRDATIAKLEQKSSILEANRMGSRATEKAAVINLRRVGLIQELLDASVRRLSNMLNKLGQGPQGVDAYKQNDDPNNANVRDVKNVLSVAERVSLVQEQLKTTLHLLEVRLTNELESLRSASAESEEEARVRLDRTIEIQNVTMESLRATEKSAAEYFEQLREEIRTYDLRLAEKDEVIEGLECSCTEKDTALEALQSELGILKSATKDGTVVTDELMSMLAEAATVNEALHEKDRAIQRLNHVIEDYRLRISLQSDDYQGQQYEESSDDEYYSDEE